MHTVILQNASVTLELLNFPHQLPEQCYWGGRCSGHRRNTAVQPQTGVPEVSFVCILFLLFIACPVHGICVCSFLWCDEWSVHFSLMHSVYRRTQLEQEEPKGLQMRSRQTGLSQNWCNLKMNLIYWSWRHSTAHFTFSPVDHTIFLFPCSLHFAKIYLNSLIDLLICSYNRLSFMLR